MEPGDLVGGRFEIEREAAAGGMGRIYLARDRDTGGRVALKMLLDASPVLKERLGREAALLAEVEHPGVVRYIAHGQSEGEPWLAMEWVDGEPLSARLTRVRPPVPEALALGRVLAGALGALHRRGIVHRDVKPANVLIVGEDLGSAVLVDLGIARGEGRGHTLTTTGQLIGTPAYMAPEQVRSHRADPRVDVHALGAVLFAVLAGRPPFEGETELAILARVLMERPPSLTTVRADVPPALAALVDRMLDKEPASRPADGDAVLAALDELALGREAPGAAGPSRTLGTAEQRVVSLLLCGPPPRPDPVARTISVMEDRTVDEALANVVALHEARLDVLRDGTRLVAVQGPDTSLERAYRAARCALAMRELLPRAPLALVTGRAVVGGPLPLGEAIDRGVALLAAEEPAPPAVRVDRASAHLLESRFEVRGHGGICELVRERPAVPSGRTVLGKPTPFVGRDWELGATLSLYDEAVEERVARAALVVGAAGSGKSRLAAELRQELARRGEPPLCLLARGDPLAAGSPFRMPADALRAVAAVVEGEAPERQRERLRARLTAAMGSNAEPAAVFLGEMIDVPFPEDHSEALRAARRDPRLMAASIRSAFEDWIAAESGRQPVLFLLDDLQWASAATVTLIDAVLRTLGNRPIVVVGLARPEVDEAFADLWADRHVQRLKLRPLPRRAARMVVRAVLGEEPDEAQVDRIVDRAEGNAFWLEEHIRAAASGEDVLPDSVLSMVQARLDSLAAEDRRVLRAASVLGETFWLGALRALTVLGEELASRLVALVDRELIVPHETSSFAGEQEFAFRNALVREAAYAMLTDEDRRLGHRLAADWLQGTGFRDAAVLAAHYDRGEAPAQAVSWYVRAGRQALLGYDYDAALARADRAASLDPDPAARGVLEAVRAEALHCKGDFVEAERHGRTALSLLERGGADWFHTLRLLIASCAGRGEPEAVSAAVTEAADAVPSDEAAQIGQAVCLAASAGQLWLLGQTTRAEDALSGAEDRMRAGQQDPVALAWLAWIRAYAALRDGDPSRCLRGMEEALSGFERAGDARYACSVRIGVGYTCTLLGLHERAERELAAAVAAAERLDMPRSVLAALNNLGYAHVQRGRHVDGCEVERRAVELAQRLANPRYEGLSRAYLALGLVGLGEPAPAEDEARKAVEVLAEVKPSLGFAHAVHARALLALGRADDALLAATQAMDLLGSLEERTIEPFVRLVHAEAMAATGDEGARERALAAARACLDDRAAHITDPELRESYLRAVPENAAILALTTP